MDGHGRKIWLGDHFLFFSAVHFRIASGRNPTSGDKILICPYKNLWDNCRTPKCNRGHVLFLNENISVRFFLLRRNVGVLTIYYTFLKTCECLMVLKRLL